MAAVSVLLAAAGAPWEAEALTRLRPPQCVVIKRCVDLPDLLASATTGQAQVAVVDGDLPGLDADAVTSLGRWGVRIVAVGERDLSGIGVRHRVASASVDALAGEVAAAAATSHPPSASAAHVAPVPATTEDHGRIIAVWGARGAPGRTTVAVALAAARAEERRLRVVLADLDPFGGSIAQHLGVLDEASGLLAAARLANSGTLTAASFAQTRRSVEPGLEVLTGLPRADRWIEVRAGVVEAMLRLAALHADVVADCGFCIEDDEEAVGPGRHLMTLETLRCADQVVVVGTADAVGLSRLARALSEVSQFVPGAPLRVVVNRWRESLGWSPDEVAAMVAGFANSASIVVLPEDVGAVDLAMLAGEPVRAHDDTDLGRGLRQLRALVFDGTDESRGSAGRWRTRWSRSKVGRSDGS